MDDTLYTRVDRYIEELFGLNDPVLQQVLESTVSAGIPEIQVSSSQGRFLYLLAKLTGARRILEIGSLAGYSTICLGRALPAGGRLISLELIEKHAEVTRHHLALAGLADRAEVVVGPAGESLAALVADGAEPFDMVFIDADKISYPVYLEWALQLTRSGSLIVADNVVRRGGVIDESAQDDGNRGARAFNAALAAEPRVEAVVLQVVGAKGHDGLAIARVR